MGIRLLSGKILRVRFLGPLTVVGIRSVIAVVFLGAVALLIPSLYRSQDPKILAEPITKNKSWILGGICGIVLFFAMYISQIGIGMTTAGKAGFITVLYICIVPFIGVFLGNKLNKFFIIGFNFICNWFLFLIGKRRIYFRDGRYYRPNQCGSIRDSYNCY